MELSSIILKVEECEAAMSALPDDIRKAICEFGASNRELILKKEAERKAKEIRLREAEEAQRIKVQKEMDGLLCKGDWGENVPRARRFALCYKKINHFVGHIGQESQDDKWVPHGEYCPIDLVRGYMSPYWGYFGGGADHCWRERIKPIMDSSDDYLLCKAIRIDWNFFKLKDKYDDFSVCEYSVDDNGHVTILQIGESKPLKDHQDDLRKEFCNVQ